MEDTPAIASSDRNGEAVWLKNQKEEQPEPGSERLRREVKDGSAFSMRWVGNEDKLGLPRQRDLGKG